MIPFFFIPANKLHKLPNILDLGIKELIIDFEDSITKEQQAKLQLVFTKLDNFTKYWYRIPLRNNFHEDVNTVYFQQMIDSGVSKIVLPKLKSIQELNKLLESRRSNNLKFILLVEHPRLFLELENILQQDYEQMIYGIGLGSHDLVNVLNANYSLDTLNYPRQKLKFIASAYGKFSIDIASMNLSNKRDFETEVKSGLDLGYDAKFIIHPQQYEWLLQVVKESPEYIWAKKIIKEIPGGRIDSNHQPFKVDGQIIEKPHLERALRIINKHKLHEK